MDNTEVGWDLTLSDSKPRQSQHAKSSASSLRLKKLLKPDSCFQRMYNDLKQHTDFFFLNEQMCYWESALALTAVTGQQAWPDGWALSEGLDPSLWNSPALQVFLEPWWNKQAQTSHSVWELRRLVGGVYWCLSSSQQALLDGVCGKGQRWDLLPFCPSLWGPSGAGEITNPQKQSLKLFFSI